MSWPQRVQLYLQQLLKTMEKDEVDPSLTAAQRVKLRGYMAVVRSAIRVIREARGDRIRRIFHEHHRDDE